MVMVVIFPMMIMMMILKTVMMMVLVRTEVRVMMTEKKGQASYTDGCRAQQWISVDSQRPIDVRTMMTTNGKSEKLGSVIIYPSEKLSQVKKFKRTV